MTSEMTSPDVETLIQQRMQAGAFTEPLTDVKDYGVQTQNA